MFIPFSYQPTGATRRPGRAFGAYLIALALLLSLLSGCDGTPSIDATSGSEGPVLSAGAGKFDRTSQTIRIPEPPRLLTRVVEHDPDSSHPHRNHEHKPEPPEVWLDRLAKAPTWDLVVHHTTHAARSIAALPRDEQRPWHLRLNRAVQAVSPLSSLALRLPKPTPADVKGLVGNGYQENPYTLCFVNFDSYSILDAFPDQAATTFVVEPYWRQDCADAGQVRVEPITSFWNHYHLVFEDPDINCLDLSTGYMGREVDGECQALNDYAAEPRFLGSMAGNEIIRIRTHDPVTGDPIPFDVPSFANASDVPVKFRYKTGGGQWYQWDSLGGPQNWGVSVYDAVEVLITHAGTSLDCGPGTEAGMPGECPVDYSPFFLDDFVIGL